MEEEEEDSVVSISESEPGDESPPKRFKEGQSETVPSSTPTVLGGLVVLPALDGEVQPQILPEIKYEYLDHTADVQIHAWGDNLQEAFEQCAMGMFAYMTDIDTVDNKGTQTIEAEGHDMLSLLFGFLDEFLYSIRRFYEQIYVFTDSVSKFPVQLKSNWKFKLLVLFCTLVVFNAEPYFISRKIEITSFDRENFKIKAAGYGETFNISKHPQGTEVKAITYSNMQFHEKEGYAEVFVIIDI